MRPRANIPHSQTLGLAALDVACLVAAVVLGVRIRWFLGSAGVFDPLIGTTSDYVADHMDGWIFFCGTIILTNYVVGSYGVQVVTSRFNIVVNWLFSLIVALLVLGITNYAWMTKILIGRGVLSFVIISYAFLSLVARSVVYWVALRHSAFVTRVAILGTGERAIAMQAMLEKRHVLPVHKVSAYVRPMGGNGPGEKGTVINGVAVVDGSVSALEDVVNSLGVDVLVVGLEKQDDETTYYPALRRLRFGGIEIMDMLTATEIYSGRIPLDLADNIWLMHASMGPSIAVVSRFKRIFDVVVALVGSIVLVPVALLVWLAVKASSPLCPAIYVQERTGQFGKRFRMYKFRTMVHGAEENGAVWSPQNDPRITWLGKGLRKFRLDEIPQLFNILRGDMSLVGPRPERPELAAELDKQMPFYRERENAPPGLTGWAQVQYPYTDNVEDARRKLEYDLYYIKNLSLALDLQIILRTLRIIILGKERDV